MAALLLITGAGSSNKKMVLSVMLPMRIRIHGVYQEYRCRRRMRQQLQRHGKVLMAQMQLPPTTPTHHTPAYKETNKHEAAIKRRSTRHRFIHNGTFHEAVSPVLVIAQCFSLMPVGGIQAASAEGLYFSSGSWRNWYSTIYICCTTVDMLFTINMAVNNTLDLARHWPALMRHWARVEQQLPPYESWQQREMLARKIHCVAFALLSLSIMEHLLSIISSVSYDFCPKRRDPIESYLYSSGSQLFYIFPYSNWLGWLGKLQNVLLTFGWNYIDIFVMIVGMGLSELLARLTRHLRAFVERPMPETFWTYVRTNYRSIVELIYEVDDAVSGIMIISFGSNLYFVCLQLLKSINNMPSVVHAVYFYFSLSFLIGRSVAVLLFVSGVHDRSREPVRLLQLVPPNGYHDEVSRLASELSNDNVALSGLKFFSITRKLFLAVAGSIVTYELVLIQFHEDEKSWDCVPTPASQTPLN